METIKYPHGEFTILWRPKTCIHSGICVRMLPQVYNPMARPWISPEKATTQELIEQVASCPSGALTMRINDAENEQE